MSRLLLTVEAVRLDLQLRLYVHRLVLKDFQAAKDRFLIEPTLVIEKPQALNGVHEQLNL